MYSLEGQQSWVVYQGAMGVKERKRCANLKGMYLSLRDVSTRLIRLDPAICAKTYSLVLFRSDSPHFHQDLLQVSVGVRSVCYHHSFQSFTSFTGNTEGQCPGLPVFCTQPRHHSLRLQVPSDQRSFRRSKTTKMIVRGDCAAGGAKRKQNRWMRRKRRLDRRTGM